MKAEIYTNGPIRQSKSSSTVISKYPPTYTFCVKSAIQPDVFTERFLIIVKFLLVDTFLIILKTFEKHNSTECNFTPLSTQSKFYEFKTLRYLVCILYADLYFSPCLHFNRTERHVTYEFTAVLFLILSIYSLMSDISCDSSCKVLPHAVLKKSSVLFSNTCRFVGSNFS